MDAFEKIARGEQASLLEAALDFATDEYPEIKVPAYLEQIQVMAEGFDIFLAGETSNEGILDALNDFFFCDLDFSPNTADYYDPRNSYLNEVIDRRLGIPISLSVLYQSLAHSAGVQLFGVNFPGHFMLACETARAHRVYIDVFGGGARLDWRHCRAKLGLQRREEPRLEEHDFAPMADHEVLERMIRNLKGIYSRKDFGRCLRVQERLVRLAPAQPSELRDLGLLYYYNSKPALAMQTLQRLIRRHPDVGEDKAVRDCLEKATREAIILN